MATLTHHLQSVHKYYHYRPQYRPDALPTARGRRISVWDRVQFPGSRSSNSSVWQRLGPAPTKTKVKGLTPMLKHHHQMLPVPASPRSKHNYLSNHLVQKNFAKPTPAKLDDYQTKYSSALATTTSQKSKPAHPSPILKPISPVQKVNKIKDKVLPANIKEPARDLSSSTNATPESPLKPPHIKSAPVLKDQNVAAEADIQESVKEIKHDNIQKSVKEIKHDNIHESVKETKHDNIHESVKEIKHDTSEANAKKLCPKRKATDVNIDSDSQSAQPLKRLREIQTYKHNDIHSNNTGMKKRKRMHLKQDNVNHQDEDACRNKKRPCKRSIEGQQLDHLTDLLAGRIQQLCI